MWKKQNNLCYTEWEKLWSDLSTITEKRVNYNFRCYFSWQRAEHVSHPLSLLLSPQCTRMASLLFILSFTLTQFLPVPLSVIILLNFTPSIAHCLSLILHLFLFDCIFFVLPSSYVSTPHCALSLSTSFLLPFHLSEMLHPCSAACLLCVYPFLPICHCTTCQFLGGGGLFGDRWRSAFHLNGDPGGEAGLGGREQLLIGQGVSPCHYAPSTALLLDQCHSVSQSVARRHGPGRC